MSVYEIKREREFAKKGKHYIQTTRDVWEISEKKLVDWLIQSTEKGWQIVSIRRTR